MRLRTLCLALALALCALPASASAAPRFERLAGFHAPGTPAKYNKVGVLKVGPEEREEHPRAEPGHVCERRVLRAARAGHRAQGEGLAGVGRRARENLLEDHSAARPREDGHRPRRSRCSTTTSAGSPTRASPTTSSSSRTRRWPTRAGGVCASEIEDLRRVVKSAQRVGDHVVVGGHSLGGSITTAYATWNFGGKPGARGLAGPRVHRRRQQPDADQSRCRGTGAAGPRRRAVALAHLRRHPGAATPASSTPPGRSGASSTRTRPSIGQAWPLLPANLKPPVPVTNAGRVRLRARHRDLAARPHRGAGPPRPPRDQRKPRRLGRRGRAHAAQALRAHVLGLGPEGTRRHRVVSPAAAHDRLGSRGRRQRATRRRRCSTCARRTATTCRGT